MKHFIIACTVLAGLTLPTALAENDPDVDLGTVCTEAAETGKIELPEGMSVEAAKSICACMGEEASGDVAKEIVASLEVYELAARMSELSEEATQLFGTCASKG